MRIKSVAAAVAVAALLAGCTSSAKPSAQKSTSPTPSPSASTYTGPPSTLPVPGSSITLSTSPAPWAPPAVVANGANSAAYVAAAGLPYAEEMLSVHYHAHLDIVVNGQKVAVPPYIGFVVNGQQLAGLAPLHTHQSDGIIHIENSVPATFLLGQFFIEWGVRLSSTCIGGYCAGSGNEFAVYVNGNKYAGDPNSIVLTKHEEIAIEYGKTGTLSPPPASYAFSGGL